MLSRITAGFIILEFEQPDWKYDWKGFLEDLKKYIPICDRDYDSELKVWHIKASEENRMCVKMLKVKYFTDPNQTDIWGE